MGPVEPFLSNLRPSLIGGDRYATNLGSSHSGWADEYSLNREQFGSDDMAEISVRIPTVYSTPTVTDQPIQDDR